MFSIDLKFSATLRSENNGQTEVVNWSPGNLLRCLNGDKTSAWDLVLSTTEFAYNNIVNKSTTKSPFEVVYSGVPRLPIDLVSLSISSRPAKFAQTFATYIHDLHVEVQ